VTRLREARFGGRREVVVDASAMIEVLLRAPGAEAVTARLFRGRDTLHAPHLLDVEVAQVLRRYARTGALGADRAAQALDDLADFPLLRYPHDLLLARVWQLRDNLTAYDAVYIALAESLGAALVTRDARLAGVPGHRARVEVI
jgi:predicted nucleic acid-binding protein